MNRIEKQAVVDNLKNVFSSAEIVIAAQNSGVTAGPTIKLRRRIKDAGGSTIVAKNTLMKLGLKGSNYEYMDSLFKGSTIMMYSYGDPVAIAKIVMDFAKENEALKVLGGGMNANSLNIAALQSLASLPSLGAIRGILIGLIQAPAAKIARIISAPGAQIARVLKAYSEK